MSPNTQRNVGITFRKVPHAQRGELWEMLQVYLRELSAFNKALKPKGNDIPYFRFDLYWRQPAQRFPFFIYSGEERAGFLLLSKGQRTIYGFTGVCVEISEICVTEHFRKQGIGRKALEFALETAEEDGFPLVWSCYVSNVSALRLYYSFASSCQQTGRWHGVITSMTDSHGCDRKNFRLERK